MSVYRPRKKNCAYASPFFQFDFESGGRRFHGTTRAKSRRAALEVERRERLAAAAAGDETTIRGAFARFWLEIGAHDSDCDTTFYRLERLQDGLTAILAEAGRGDLLAAVSENELAQYVTRRRLAKSRHGRPLAPSTINRELQLLRRVMRRAAITWKLSLALPDWKTVLLAEPEEHVVDIPLGLEAEILTELRADYRPALRFLVMSGLRRGSVLKGGAHGPLTAAEVDLAAGILTVKVKSKKPGGKTLRLPITQAMRVLLANEIGKHPAAVFTYVASATRDGRRHGHRYPIVATSFYSEFKRAAAKCGHPELRVHDLRHTAGNRTLAATGNLRLTQKLLGHSRVSTTQLYTHPDLEALREALESVHRARSPEISPEATDTPTAKPHGKRSA